MWSGCPNKPDVSVLYPSLVDDYLEWKIALALCSFHDYQPSALVRCWRTLAYIIGLINHR